MAKFKLIPACVQCSRSRQIAAIASLVAALLLAAAPARADEEAFVDMDLDALMQLDITSVARRPMKADETPAASFVITQEDIRRTGATTIPELLRLVPGFEVADIDNSYSAVAARGFNWRSSNKLLILIDGRSVYRSAFLGVLWDQQIIAVEEIERIEVLRGPGAALWGANAVNGVVNIVTKHAVDSLGGRATIRYGANDAGRFYVRQGFRVGDNGALRLYATGRRDPALVDDAGEDLTEDSKGGQFGFRFDWEPTSNDAFTLQGDIIDFEAEQPLEFFTASSPTPIGRNEPVLGDSANILGRWVRRLGDDSGLNIQVYFEHLSRQEIDNDLVSNARTYSIEATHYFPLAGFNTVVWGLGYNRAYADATGNDFVAIDQTEVRENNFFGFLHNDAHLFDDRLLVSAGVRVEHNPYTQWEVHPHIRALWRAPDDWRLWAAVSRATRTPALSEMGGVFDLGALPPLSPFNESPLPAQLTLRGNLDLESEPLIAYELGARKKWDSGISLDLALYAHQYRELVDVALLPPELIFAPVGPGGTPAPVALDVTASFANTRDVTLYGVEAAIDATITDFWNIKLIGDARHFDGLDASEQTMVGFGVYLLRRSPTYQVGLQSNFQVTRNLDASIWVRRTGRVLDTSIEPRTELDLRVGWRPTNRVEVTLLGENLIKARRPAATDLNFLMTTQGFIERHAALQLAVRF